MNPFRLIVLIVVVATIAAFGGWILFCMVRGWVRYYRDHKPRPMAIRNDQRDWQKSFTRIVSGK